MLRPPPAATRRPVHRTTATMAGALTAIAMIAVVGACTSETPTADLTQGQAASSSLAPPTMPALPSTAASSPVATPSEPAAPAPAAAEVLSKVKAKATGATSGAFAGTLTQGGQELRITYVGTSDGKTSDVTIGRGSQGVVRIITVGDNVYLQGDAAFWKGAGAPPEIQAAGGKFVKVPDAEANLAESMNIKTLVNEAFESVTAEQLSDTVGSEMVGAVDCWVLTDEDGIEQGAIYVSKSTFDLVRFTGSTDNPGRIDFSGWNAAPTVVAPKPADLLLVGPAVTAS